GDDRARAGGAGAVSRAAGTADARRCQKGPGGGERPRPPGGRGDHGRGARRGGTRMSAVPWTVRLAVLQGAVGLLLHLIKKNEVQITDIPIASITDQYLVLLEELPELNLDGAGEYLVMAATLMYIKSRMLLPPDPDEDGEPEADPRAELVQQLLEYQRFREAAADLGERRILGRDVFAAA